MSNKDNKTQYLFVEADRGVIHDKDGMRRCMGCMELYSSEFELCPECGCPANLEAEKSLHICPGTVLNEKYVVGRVLGYGGFGVTYLAWDTILQIKVAIKEYLPSEFSTRSVGQTRITVFSGEKSKQFCDGKDKFIDEAKRLAIFRNELGIVKIFDTFEENGTAYIVMEYLEGETLEAKLQREGKVPADDAVKLIMPVVESLNRIHDAGIVHRDIAPDNLFLTTKGETKLIDFGASRYATAVNDQSLTVIVKQRYSPEEQYRSKGDQGPHTDVYAMGAVLYRMITGVLPPDAMERVAQCEKSGVDILVPIKKYVKGIDKNLENAIYNAMNIRIEDRTPDMISFAGELLSTEHVKLRKNSVKKADPLTWPLWAKIGVPLITIALVALSVLVAFGIIGPKSTLKTDFDIPEGQTLVPDVVATELEIAQEKLESNSLQWRIKDTKSSETIKSGLVLMHEPDAGNITPIGTYVDITISSGLGTAFVEDFSGYDCEDVKKVLEEFGFVVEIKKEKNNDYGSEIVFDQSIKNMSAEKGSKIVLYVSKGKDYDTQLETDIPNVVGLTYVQAKALTDENNLVIVKNIEAVFDETKEAGTIVYQAPKNGDKAHHGDRVTVTINLGSKTARVPNVVNITEEKAKEELEDAGFAVNIEYGQNRNYAEGTVYGQSVEANERLACGKTVTLTVCNGYSEKVPDVRNLKLEQAQLALKKSGFASAVKEYQISDSIEKGCIISQSVAAGTLTDSDTVIYLVVSSGIGSDKSLVTSGNILGEGVCGSNLKWILYNDGKLVISGSGDMYDNPDWVILSVNIKEVFFSGKITSIGKSAFESCVNLAQIVIPATVKTIGNKAFDSCTSLKSVVISEGVSQIGANAFASCSSLTSVSIPQSVTSIGDYAFNSCTSLNEVNIPQKINGLSENAFTNCNQLTQVKVADETQSLEKYLLENTSEVQKTTKDSQKNVTSTVANKNHITQTTKASTQSDNSSFSTEISDEVLEQVLKTGTNKDGTAVSEQTMQDAIKYALENSTELNNVKISDEMMEKIAIYALKNGDSLKNIEISDEMMQKIVEFALKNGDSLNNISISDTMMKEILVFLSENGSVLSNLTISDGMMKEIIRFISENGGSLNNMNLSKELMSEIVKFISNNASVLKELNISDSLMKEILSFMSSNSSALKEISISDEAKQEIKDYILENGSSLQGVTVPRELIDFGMSGF